MSEILFIVGDVAVTTGAALMAFAGLVLALLLVIAFVLARGSRQTETASLAQAIRADELEERLADMLRARRKRPAACKRWAKRLPDASRRWRGWSTTGSTR
jgi:DNA recombination protein RmuC